MKFSIEAALASGGRIGKITTAARHGTVSCETPMCTLFTKGGSAPFLSVDMLQRIDRVPEIATMSLDSFAEQHENIAKCGKSLGVFTAMKDKLIFLTMHDASVAVPSGKNDKTGIAVWGKGGKVKIDPPLFQQIHEGFQPDWSLAMGDADTDQTCARKRLTKAVNKTLDFLDDIVEGRDKSKALLNNDFIGSIVGGFNLEERKRCAKETAARGVQGFLIEGFEKGYSGVDLFDLEHFSAVLKGTIDELPPELPRITETVWSPLQVVKAFRLGVDIFSSAYPHTLTEKGLALVANHKLLPKNTPKPEETTASSEGSVESLNKKPVIDLHHKRFFEDFGPLSSSCDCYTCKTFSCSYIHHLLNTSELLAYVLLTIHNFHQYFEFFHNLREAAAQDRVEELEQILSHQQEPEETSTR